jgi:hypothetical protein
LCRPYVAFRLCSQISTVETVGYDISSLRDYGQRDGQRNGQCGDGLHNFSSATVLCKF